MRLVLALIASLVIGGCAVLAGAGLGGAGGFFVAGPPGAQLLALALAQLGVLSARR